MNKLDFYELINDRCALMQDKIGKRIKDGMTTRESFAEVSINGVKFQVQLVFEANDDNWVNEDGYSVEYDPSNAPSLKDLL